MRIIILGAGESGFEIAKKLSQEQHNVVVIEKDPAGVQYVRDNLDVMALQGNGASSKLLEQAGVTHADMLIAVTNIDEINIVACMVAKHHGVKKTVARVRNTDYWETSKLTPDKIGIDLMINPEHVVALEMVRQLRSPAASEIMYFAEGKVQIRGFRVEEGSKLAYKPIKDIRNAGLIGLIIRKGDPVVPNGEEVIHPNDTIFIISKTGTMTELSWLAGKSEQLLNNVMILGGGRIGLHIAKELEKYIKYDIDVKLIEEDAERCAEIAAQLPHTLVLHGNGTEIEFLKQEGISETDAFIAVSGDDDVNIMAALLAKQNGVNKVIAQVDRHDYAQLVETLGIDMAISPRFTVASMIIRLIRERELVSVKFLNQGKVEIEEFKVAPEAKVCNKRLGDIDFPQNSLVVAILRDGQVIIPDGRDIVRADDDLIVIAVTDAVPRVERLFFTNDERFIFLK